MPNSEIGSFPRNGAVLLMYDGFMLEKVVGELYFGGAFAHICRYNIWVNSKIKIWPVSGSGLEVMRKSKCQPRLAFQGTFVFLRKICLSFRDENLEFHTSVKQSLNDRVHQYVQHNVIIMQCAFKNPTLKDLILK